MDAAREVGIGTSPQRAACLSGSRTWSRPSGIGGRSSRELGDPLVEDGPAGLVVVHELARVGDQVGGVVDQLCGQLDVGGRGTGAGEIGAKRGRSEVDAL